ncbi:MAG: restriction endonuclease subunit S [Bacteroidetes bacterium]|nr:MAG: restriction endonuclease subunit S [Bacteroidota bacterium]
MTRFGLSQQAIKEAYFLVPPKEEQIAIVKFLDAETGKIDTLIREFGSFHEFIIQKRQALVSHAVIRGVKSDASFADTGFEWIGEIPNHWHLEFTRWLLPEVDERSVTGEEELLTVSHITGVTLRSEKDVNMFEAESNEGYKLCQPGDLVINTLWAWMGAMGVAFQEGIVSPAYHVYRHQGDYDPQYLDYLVRLPNFAKEVARYSKGVWSSRLRLYPDEFYKIVLPVPPLDEQREIVAYLDKEIAKLDELSKAVQETIELLKERRSALIAAAVTGKIRVTE